MLTDMLDGPNHDAALARILWPKLDQARRQLRGESGTEADIDTITDRALDAVTEAEKGELRRAHAKDIIEAWIADDEARALAGDLDGPYRLVRVRDGTLIERDRMTVNDWRERLAHVADDPDPRREVERAWLRDCIATSAA